MTQTNIRGWRKVGAAIYETEEGFHINESNLKDICSYAGVPSTLVNVDKKYGTNTFQQVIVEATPQVNVLVADDMSVQVLDPKSEYMEDEQFEELIARTEHETGLVRSKTDEGKFSKRVTFDIPVIDSDIFCGDVFTKSMTIERLPQGGINFATALLRQVCTNGMVIPDKQYKNLIRMGGVDSSVISSFHDAIRNLSLKDYFNSLFFKGGEAVHASVADYIGMSKTLADITNDDYAEVLFPMDIIKSFYEGQSINIDTLSLTNLNRLPSGLKYYEAFNILTNGAKMADKNVSNEMKVAHWIRPSRLSQIKQSDITFSGTPVFDEMAIRGRMGDLKS